MLWARGAFEAELVMGLDLIPTVDIPEDAFEGIEGLIDGGGCLAGRIYDIMLRQLGVRDTLYEDHEPGEVKKLYRALKRARIPADYHQPHTLAEYGSWGMGADRTIVPHEELYVPFVRWLEVLIEYESGFEVDY